jgi:hypothetical protein
MKTQRFTLQNLSAAMIALTFAGAGSLSGTALAEEAAPAYAAPPVTIPVVPAVPAASPVAEAPATPAVPAASPEAKAPATPAATAPESTPDTAPPGEERAEQTAPGQGSSTPYSRYGDDIRQRMEARREARQQAMEQYRSARRWWNNPYSEQRRLWNKSRLEWYQKQAEQRREYIEQQRPAYSYEYELPGYDYEYTYGPGYYYGRNDTTPGRWSGTPYGGRGPWY